MFGYNAGVVLTAALFTVRLYAAFKGIISDCDEVYNYWEPLNLLVRFFGKKTWEYQPEFAIRSWAYLIQYAVFKYPYQWVVGTLALSTTPAYAFFYFVRVVFALAFALSESYLASVLTNLSPEIAEWFLVFQITSPGVFTASVSFLPSTYALLFGMYAAAGVLHFCRFDGMSKEVQARFVSSLNPEQRVEQLQEPESSDDATIDATTIDDTTDIDDTTIDDAAASDDPANQRNPIDIPLKHPLTATQRIFRDFYGQILAQRDRGYAIAVLATAFGGLLGWPFALVLIAPFVVYAFATLVPSGEKAPASFAVVNDWKWSFRVIFPLVGFGSLFLPAWIGVNVDTLFYNDISFVPYNIVSYNVVNSTDKTGPQIFGTEPLSYYPLNLLLNFHFIFLMSILDVPGILPSAHQLTFWQSVALYRAPLAIWYGVFWSQPHKEERFMYPVYHLISLSAAIFATNLTNAFAGPKSNSNSNSCGFLYYSSRFLIFGVCVLTGLLRVISVVDNYSAPLTAFRSLANYGSTPELANVCIGREWYHYPSSFFLEDNQRLRYVPSGFRGMLPGDFVEPESHSLAGLRNVTRISQPGFNNENQYNPDFVLPSLDKCDFYVDIGMPVDPDMGEVQVFNELGHTTSPEWETIRCDKMIDPDRSYGLAKLIYLPIKEVNSVRAAWQHNHYVKALKETAAYQKITDLDTYKPITDNEFVQKVYGKVAAEAIALDDKYHLSSKLPGEVVYHEFCVAHKA